MTMAIGTLQQIRDSAKRFAGLMNLYETNYIRFMQLVSGLDCMGDKETSMRLGEVTLYLSITERSPYTTTCHLTYRLQSQGETIQTPDMTVRIYHDAAQAEVLSCCHQDPDAFDWLDRQACRSNLQWRWRANRFLFHWLNYCLQQGHGFPQRHSGKSFQQLKQELTNPKK